MPLCPHCSRDSLIDGICLHCGPDAGKVRAPAPASAPEKGWGALSKEPVRKVEAPRPALTPALIEETSFPWGPVFGLAIVLGIAAMFATGQWSPPAPMDVSTGLPTQLVRPPSPARGELGRFANALLELVRESQHRLTTNPDLTDAEIQRYLDRLARLHDVGRKIEPQLTREESRVLMALQNGEKLTATFIRSFLGTLPELDGGHAMAAEEQISRALALARGEAIDDPIVQYTRKAGEAARVQKVMEGEH